MAICVAFLVFRVWSVFFSTKSEDSLIFIWAFLALTLALFTRHMYSVLMFIYGIGQLQPAGVFVSMRCIFEGLAIFGYKKAPRMEDSYSVKSLRRILSLSKKGQASVSFQDSGENLSWFLPGEHGPKTSKVYGFVGSITTVVATAIFLIWANVPESWLHSVGIVYYPSRYWALAVPTYAMVTILLALGFYIGLNFMSTPPPTSLNTIFDEFNRESSSFKFSMEGDDQPIEPISDNGIDRINHIMFNYVKSK